MTLDAATVIAEASSHFPAERQELPERARLIAVDDEPELREMLTEYLARHGFDVRGAAGGRELDEMLAERPADLLLLDVNMPGEDGLSIARRMRATSAVAIMMLTSASDVVDRVVGLEIGADDYVTKPFDLRELLARVRTVLRRARPEAPAPAAPVDREPVDREPIDARHVRFGAVRLDLDRRCLIRPSGETSVLTAMEFDLLQAFAQHPNRVLNRDQLLDFAHNRGWEPFDRSIDIRIARIRRKIEVDPAKPEVIKTVRGVGYLFVSGRP
jgi:two-component system phosphate regulon response regulator OmpR